MLKLMYITNDPAVAKIAADAGVDRIFIDMEVLGKAERQGGMDTVQSHHVPEDIAKVRAAIGGSARPEAFALKILFTAVTIGAGFKGGEIVPTFFIGSTFGCVAGSLLGLDPGFAAAVGLIALFCGVVNSPIASMILSIELFGAQGLILFAIACGVSFMLSGYYGLYSSQKIMYSKLRAEYINIHAK